MKPSGILLFLISVLLLLLAVSLYFPKEGIRLTSGLHLRFVSPVEILAGRNNEYADISDILRRQAMLNDSVIAGLSNETVGFDTVRANVDSLLASITRIEYPNGDPSVLYPFFRSLSTLKSSGELIRILHYGDSQIEDDRITSYLRNQLQLRFGGSGVGLVHPAPLYPYAFSMTQENSDNWSRYIVCGTTDTTLEQTRYGAMAGFGTFIQDDATATNEAAEAWVQFSPSPYAYDNTKSFERCRIFYGYNKQPFMTQLFLNDSLIDADIMPASEELQMITWNFDSAQTKMRISFSGPSSPEIYGIALDGETGIAVDNIPLRGCSGPFLTRIDKDLLEDMYDELDVKLFILQFGGNMVPAVINNFSGYENWFTDQITRIRETCPDAAVLVIGVADMSMKEKSRYVTNPNVEKVREALRNAAFKSDAAFWDMYQAMGGRNSMPSWVFAEPSLAAGDFVHFNHRGAKTIAQLFYNAFMLEYNRFENTARK